MRETIYKMVVMLEITSTPDLLTKVIMKCPDLFKMCCKTCHT